ncbi:MAG: DUF72 domain-containing protein [Candidatus Kariarchaeaceae archaeon]|jgi:uncharacterized protein YecE (DUF72 family)
MKESDNIMIYLGTVNWRYPHWVGSFYPNDDEDQWLPYYAKQSSFTEVRTTYSRFLSSEIINHWDSSTPENFIFSASVHKQITYDKQNEIQKNLITKFFDVLAPLGNKLGLVILHFPKQLQNNEKNLEFVLGTIDACHEHFNGYIVVDVSNRSWFKDDINQLLVDREACMLNSDRKPVGSSMSNPNLYYLKLSGDTRIIPKKSFGTTYFPRDGDIKHWSNHLKFKSKRHKKIFVSIDNHFSGDSTKDGYMLSTAIQDNKVKITGFTNR